MLYYGLILSLQKKMENWKFINANYEVSDKGNIKSVNYRERVKVRYESNLLVKTDICG